MAEAIIISKKVLFEETFTAGELLTALKDKILSKSTLIQLTTDNNYGMLSAVYECRHCSRIHLLATKSFTDRKKLQKYLYNHAKIVYGNTNDEDGIEKKDLMAILEKIENKETKLSMETMKDAQNDQNYTVTIVAKCANPNCRIIHISAEYDKDAPNLN